MGRESFLPRGVMSPPDRQPSCGMLWFTRRSYLKWAAAAMIVGVSWWIQLMPAPTTLHPFAATDIEAGSEIHDDLFEFRRVPVGLLPPTTIQGTLTVAMAAGEPLLASLVAVDRVPAPDGWWAVELESPPGLTPGKRVMLIAGEQDPGSPGQAIPGIVISPGLGRYESEDATLIAVPGQHLSRVSSASAYGTLTVAVAPNR